MIKVYDLPKDPDKEVLNQLHQLYLAAGWWNSEDGDPRDLITLIIKGSFCFAVAVENNRIIGMGRAISDGISDAYIQDVTVFQEFRQQGIGGKIIDFMVDFLHQKSIGWIGLISEPGYESFYSKLGFAVMPQYTPFLYKEK